MGRHTFATWLANAREKTEYAKAVTSASGYATNEEIAIATARVSLAWSHVRRMRAAR